MNPGEGERRKRPGTGASISRFGGATVGLVFASALAVPAAGAQVVPAAPPTPTHTPTLVPTPTAQASSVPTLVPTPLVLPTPQAPTPLVPTRPAWIAVMNGAFNLPNDAGSPIAQSSPNVAVLNGQPSVVVGDRASHVYAFPLQQASFTPRAVPGWPTVAAGPVDSTPSVNGSNVYVGSGDAGSPLIGGYQAFDAAGHPLWFSRVVDPPTDTQPDVGVQASLAVGTLQGTASVTAGSLGQEEYALNATSGATLSGWPFFGSDSVFSTAALADLYGTGRDEVVEGAAQSAGFADGQIYTPGGHVRIFTASGSLVCHFDTDETVESSPAVGGFLAGGSTGIAVGTGAFYPGVSDFATVKAVTPTCGLAWSDRLDGRTDSSPALADVIGNGRLQVVEGTAVGPALATGSVWVLDGATGTPIWHAATTGGVIGSVVTADLGGTGHQDLIVPTTRGVDIFDGASGQLVETLDADATSPDGILGFQNAPLVTDDPNGDIGITLAGYNGFDQGLILHYVVPHSDGASVDESGAWPMFHHDPQLTGDAGGTPAPGSVPGCAIPSASLGGYDLVALDGGVFNFGGQRFCGSTGGRALNQPIVAMAMAPGRGGYWLVGADGGVFAFGGAHFFGSTGGLHLNQPVVGMAATPDGRGYWLVGADGGVFAFGDARFLGSAVGDSPGVPIMGIAASADGLGYRLVNGAGGVYDFGDAQYFGGVSPTQFRAPVTGIALDVATGGYWLADAAGNVFSFNAPFLGASGTQPPSTPVLGIAALENGTGYRLVTSAGQILAFGNAPFLGSMAGQPLAQRVIGLAGF